MAKTSAEKDSPVPHRALGKLPAKVLVLPRLISRCPSVRDLCSGSSTDSVFVLEDESAIELAAEFIVAFRASEEHPSRRKGGRPMIGLGTAALKVFVALEPADMRKSFNGLYDIAVNHLANRRLEREVLFVFTNKRRNRIKLLYFDGTGLWVAAKRLESGKFSWPKPSTANQKKLHLTPEALQMLLDGVDLRGGTFKPWYEREQSEEKFTFPNKTLAFDYCFVRVFRDGSGTP